MRFSVRASVGNGGGVFDAAYDFGRDAGEEAGLTGTPDQIGAAVARYLSLLTPEACREMRYGTGRFFVELVISPADDAQGASLAGSSSPGPGAAD